MPDQTIPAPSLFGRWRALPKDSIPKTLFVAITLCLFCSMIVAFAAVSMRPLQEANKLRDMQVNILQVAGLYDKDRPVDELFTAFTPKIVDLEAGIFTDQFDDTGFNPVSAARDPELSIALTDDPAIISRRGNFARVYLLHDAAGVLDRVIVPVYGAGLWGRMHGFIALQEDGNEIYGLQFYQHAETPGLGDRIDKPDWRRSWHGQMLRNAAGDLKIAIATGTPTEEMKSHHIDGLAGATLTARGVDNLVRFWMGEQGFGPFLANLKAGAI